MEAADARPQMPAAGATGVAASACAVPGASATPPSPQQEPFVLRIVALDHYMASPLPGVDCSWSELEGGPVQQVRTHQAASALLLRMQGLPARPLPTDLLLGSSS